MSTLPLYVLKFGGTSLAGADAIRQAVSIIQQTARTKRVVVVASAMAGVTDALVQAVETQDETVIERVRMRHRDAAAALLDREAWVRYDVVLGVHLASLQRTLGRMAQGKNRLDLRDAALAVGERLAAPLLTAAIGAAGLRIEYRDAARLLCTDGYYGAATVDAPKTRQQVLAWYTTLQARTVAVVPGFFGGGPTGRVTTLGRGGSDYAAAALAAALGAHRLERWTDVDGLYTADPRRDANARPLRYVFLEEALGWNHEHRLGMHPRALDPLVRARIPLRIRSTARPDLPGTLLLPRPDVSTTCKTIPVWL